LALSSSIRHERNPADASGNRHKLKGTSMNTSTLTVLLQIAALLHIGLLCAGASMPKAVNLRGHIATLPPFIRQLFLVYFSFIALMLVGFGSLTFLFAHAMAAGEPTARALCIMMTVFWSVRLVVAGFVFDVRPYLTNWFYRLGYQATNLVFVYLVAVYALAVWKGGAA
jgi:hypothetical protein